MEKDKPVAQEVKIDMFKDGVVLEVEIAGPFGSVTEKALVDTGASNTCIDVSIAKKLSLTAESGIEVQTPSGKTTQPVYKAEVGVVEGDNRSERIKLDVFGSIVKDPKYRVLLGRDILRSAVFMYDGINNRWSLEFYKEGQ